jgi:drug/metabolite transporter (DMT)-like permease
MKLVHLYVLLAVTFWGWSFVATKVLLRYLTATEVLGARLLLGVPLLALLMFSRGGRPRFARREWGTVAGGGLVLLLHFVIQITALKYTSATNTGWIIAVTPLTIALLSFLFLGERLTVAQVLGIAIATLGILLLVSGGRPSTLGWLASRGDWLVLASTSTWALYTVGTRNLSRARDPLTATTMMLTVTAVVVIGFMLFSSDGDAFVRLPAEAVAAALFLGFACSAVAFWFWQQGVAQLGAARTGFFLYLEPVATTALAVPYLGESFTVVTVAGGLLVLAGVYLAGRRRARQPRNPTEGG